MKHLIIILIFILSNFSIASNTCESVFANIGALESPSKPHRRLIRRAQSRFNRQLSTVEQETIIELYDFIQQRSEPLSPQELFDRVAYDLEKSGFNLYELWDIAHRNILRMPFAQDRKNFRKLVRGELTKKELGVLKHGQTGGYPPKLKCTGGYCYTQHGSFGYAYHSPRKYKKGNTYLNNSDPISARILDPFGVAHDMIVGWYDYTDVQRAKIKGPTGRYFIPTGGWDHDQYEYPNGRTVEFTAVYFIYEGKIIKGYDADEGSSWEVGHVHPVTLIVSPKHRKDMKLLKYSLLRMKSNEGFYDQTDFNLEEAAGNH